MATSCHVRVTFAPDGLKQVTANFLCSLTKLRELGDKVPAGDRAAIEKSVNELREALKGEDVTRIKTLTEQVQQASYALSQQLYQRGAENAANGGSAGPGTGRNEGDVVEGEFRAA
mgnify:CR=1 FL=1